MYKYPGTCLHNMRRGKKYFSGRGGGNEFNFQTKILVLATLNESFCNHKLTLSHHFKSFRSGDITFSTLSNHIFNGFSQHIFSSFTRHIFNSFSQHIVISLHLFSSFRHRVLNTVSRHIFKRFATEASMVSVSLPHLRQFQPPHLQAFCHHSFNSFSFVTTSSTLPAATSSSVLPPQLQQFQFRYQIFDNFSRHIFKRSATTASIISVTYGT